MTSGSNLHGSFVIIFILPVVVLLDECLQVVTKFYSNIFSSSQILEDAIIIIKLFCLTGSLCHSHGPVRWLILRLSPFAFLTSLLGDPST